MKHKRIQVQPINPSVAPLSAMNACYLGAAEAMKYGAAPESRQVTQAQLRAASRALRFFDDLSDDEMALALLVAMVALGRRVEEKERQL